MCAIGPGFDLAKLAGDGKIATGDVKAVPVGKYAKAALEKLGAWTAAEPKFAMAESVRAALTLVARGEAALGIVYSTDAKVEPGVKIVGTFPADSHPADHLSGGGDHDREAGDRRLSRLPAFLGGQGHPGKIRLQVSGQPDDMTTSCRHCEPPGRANARPMINSAEAIQPVPQAQAGLLRRKCSSQ